jgi:hypothetical protein
MKFLVPVLLVLGACSPSPLYVDRAQIGTAGEVPRDARGEPIWSAIGPAPATVPQRQAMPQPTPQPTLGPTLP